ncbi:MAG: hypothetical protein KAJ67_09230 [Gemmatimonadetes bacterium]|nr:hypothetical protein [Gemmatimonadota bacterium]
MIRSRAGPGILGPSGAALFLALLVAACSQHAGSDSAGDPAGSLPPSERTLRQDLLILHRDQEAFLIRYGAYAPTLRELDYSASDGVTVSVRWVTRRSYYAFARLGKLECFVGGWHVRSDLPGSIQTKLMSPGRVSCDQP